MVIVIRSLIIIDFLFNSVMIINKMRPILNFMSCDLLLHQNVFKKVPVL